MSTVSENFPNFFIDFCKLTSKKYQRNRLKINWLGVFKELTLWVKFQIIKILEIYTLIFWNKTSKLWYFVMRTF